MTYCWFKGAFAAVLFSPFALFAQTKASFLSLPSNQSYIINADDTLNFRLQSSFSNGVYTDIPVYFSSDDTVYAVDFALKFNMQLMEFDTLINHTGSLQYLYYLNPADSVLRFTSNSTSPLSPAQPLVSVRMRNYLQPVCFSDLILVDSRLNGDACSGSVSGCIPGVSGIPGAVTGKKMEMYFNYQNRALTVELTEDGTFELFDLAGRTVYRSFLTAGENTIPLGNDRHGSRILVGVLTGSGSVHTGKVFVCY